MTAHGSAPHPSTQRLDGWKEISRYLGRNIRTAQRWERELQLPIRRVGTTKGASVFALASEIDAWLAAQDFSEPASERSATPDESDPNVAPDQNAERLIDASQPAPSLLPSTPRTLVLGAILGVLLVVVLTGGLFRRATPSNYRIEQNALVVIDAEGREMWRKNFSSIHQDPGLRHPVWIGDLAGNGTTVVLYAHFPASASESDPVVLYCYSDRGKQLWSFTPGRTVRTAFETFEPPYGIQDFAVVADRGRKYVVVSSIHYRYFPTQVAVLSPSGKLVSEYWHSGSLGHVAAGDLNHDGKTELYLTGIDNQYRMATLVMLDLDTASGASPESNPHYQILDMPIARERGRAYFRPSCISHALQPYNQATDMRFGRDNIWVSVLEQPANGSDSAASVDYDLTPNLELKNVSVPDFFATVHKQLEKKGVLDHAFAEDELKLLRNIKQP